MRASIGGASWRAGRTRGKLALRLRGVSQALSPRVLSGRANHAATELFFMRYTFLLTSLLALTAVTLVGCGDDDATPPTSTPVALADFCPQFVDAICDNVARCSCSATADADCRADLTDTCPNSIVGPDIRAHIGSGTVVYDASAAGAMIAGVRAETSCENPMTTFGWRVADVFTFGGMLNGTVAAGATCDAGSGDSPIGGECLDGVCSGGSGGGPAICVHLAGIGEPCGTGISSLCVNLDARFTSLEGSDLLLRCNVAAGASTGTCAALLASGAACAAVQDCASHRCEAGVCAPGVANGEACSSSLECLSSFCDYSATPSACAPASTVAISGACTDDQQCVSGVCRGNVCVGAVCGLYSEPVPPPAVP